MGLKGVRVLTFSPFEMKAFGGFGYELKKKAVWHTTNIASTWYSMLPIMSGTLATFTSRLAAKFCSRGEGTRVGKEVRHGGARGAARAAGRWGGARTWGGMSPSSYALAPRGKFTVRSACPRQASMAPRKRTSTAEHGK